MNTYILENLCCYFPSDFQVPHGFGKWSHRKKELFYSQLLAQDSRVAYFAQSQIDLHFPYLPTWVDSDGFSAYIRNLIIDHMAENLADHTVFLNLFSAIAIPFESDYISGSALDLLYYHSSSNGKFIYNMVDLDFWPLIQPFYCVNSDLVLEYIKNKQYI